MRATTPHAIPFSRQSADALWHWNIPTDELTLSEGALRALGLQRSDQLQTMSEFLTHIPPYMLPALNAAREGVLSGKTGSRLDSSYVFGSYIVNELLLVLERNEKGRARVAMGHYQIQSEPCARPTEQKAEISSVGIWQYSSRDGNVRLDRHCAMLLGIPGKDGEYTALTLPRNVLLANVHPDDMKQIDRDYEMQAGTLLMGDTLEHTARVRTTDGSYVPMKFRGSVIERDLENGTATFAGTLSNLTSPVPQSGQADLALQDSRRLIYTVNSTGDGLWDWDAYTNHVYFSPRYLSMLGYTAEEFPGHLDVWANRIHPDDHDKIIYPQRAIVESPRYGDTFECTYRLLRKDGTWAWILGRGYVTNRDKNGKAIRIVGMHTDITAVQNEREQLEEMVKNDPLTGLRSRAYCDLEMERIESNHIRPVAAILADITGLKLVNDCLGHAAGDKLLACAAILMREPMRATDCVARTGGDEFVILLPGCTEERAAILQERLRQCLQRHNEGTPEIPVYAAVGMAATDNPDTPLSTILRKADARMMENKRADRAHDQACIKRWIEARTGRKVEFEDCRLIG